MALSVIWTVLVTVSVLCGLFNGVSGQVAAAMTDGARAAVTLSLGLCGITCLWSGIIELMRTAGFLEKLAQLLRPLLRRLFPQSAADAQTMAAAGANFSANLLGLGNAATPAGILAAGRMEAAGHTRDLAALVVLNSASIQLIPTTVAAVRANAGSAAPFDILPAVWVTSLVSCLAGLGVLRLLLGRRR